jgi:alpha-D-xyloside xylohydrolase
VDYQTGRRYAGAQWLEVVAGPIPVVLMVRDHVVIPLAAVAQSSASIDWSRIELRAYSSDAAPVAGLFSLPDGTLLDLRPETPYNVADEFGTAFAAEEGKSAIEKGPCP